MPKRIFLFTALAVSSLVAPAMAQPEVALNGYCPVSYHTLDKAVQGDSAFTSTYQGWTYYLADAQTKTTFDTDPERYVPRFGGLCTTALGGTYGNRFAADPKAFKVHDGKLYMFSSERALRNFKERPEDFIAMATERFNKPAINGYCPVAYHSTGTPTKGVPEFKVLHRTSIYYFADQVAKESFLKDPEKYVPAYEGFCAEGVSRGKRFPADSTVFLIHEGRTYLFFDAAARKTFQDRPTEIIQAANTQWRTLRNAAPTPQPPTTPTPP